MFLLTYIVFKWMWILVSLQLGHSVYAVCLFYSWTYIIHALQQQQQQSFYSPLSGTTRVSRYQKNHSPTHHPDHHPIFISFFHLLWSIASSLFKLCAFCTTSLHVLFGRRLGLEPSTSYSIPYTSSPSQCLLFATHAHTIATCFAVVLRLYHLHCIYCTK